MSDSLARRPTAIRPRLPAIGVRRVRLASGLVLFTYVTLHLADHALLNISIGTAEAMLDVMKRVWQSLPGAMLLYTALLAHLGLAFWALYERRYFQWRRSEALQLVLGFSIPILLANHILVTRVSASVYGTDKTYFVELYSFWVGAVWLGIMQHLVLAAAWGHGCIGIYLWLRLRRWFAGAQPWLLSAAVLLPALALLGSFQGGRIVRHLATDPAWRHTVLTLDRVGTPEQDARLAMARGAIWAASGAGILLVLCARALRRLREQRAGLIHISYASGHSAAVPRGLSVLDASRLHRVPHHSLCGGRGRCTTCRVRVLGHGDAIPPPDKVEQAALTRLGLENSVRLACQLRPRGDIGVALLLPPDRVLWRTAPRGGTEGEVVAMFVDLRGSTRLAEHHLPFDTVFLLNSFLNAVGQAVLAEGGQTNQMLGDGLLALFGLDCAPDIAARQALRAAAVIVRNVDALNRRLAGGLGDTLRFGIGIAGGTAVIGDIGFEQHMVFTALGDPVNIAARLEGMTKDFACDLLVTSRVYASAGLGDGPWPEHEINVRGRDEALHVRAATNADLLRLLA